MLHSLGFWGEQQALASTCSGSLYPKDEPLVSLASSLFPHLGLKGENATCEEREPP